MCLSLATACGESGSSDGASTGGDGLDSGLTDTDTDSTGTTTADTDATDSMTTGDGDGDGDGDTDGLCESNDDCNAGEICNTATGECQNDCGSANVVLEAVPPPVVLVLDKSGSMVKDSNKWDHDGDPMTPVETRWATLYSVSDFILTNFESSIRFGLQLFPQADAEAVCAQDAGEMVADCPACAVDATPDVAIAIDNRDAILGAMPAQDTEPGGAIQGATPAAAGLASAKAALDAAVAADPSGTTGALIFITDGAANCSTQYADELCTITSDSSSCKVMDYFDDQVEPLIGGYFADGTPTYVVGIDIEDELLDPTSLLNFQPDNTNVYTELNATAIAGGVPQTGGSESFYNATNEAELMDALSQIAGEIASCDIDLSVDPNTPPATQQIPYVEFTMMNMTVPGPLEITPEECDMGTEDGWIWVELGVSVRFCGSYCEQLKTTGEVDGIYGCPPAG